LLAEESAKEAPSHKTKQSQFRAIPAGVAPPEWAGLNCTLSLWVSVIVSNHLIVLGHIVFERFQAVMLVVYSLCVFALVDASLACVTTRHDNGCSG